MNGIVVTSLDGGMLLYERAYVNNFGIDSSGINALQLSSSLFTLYSISLSSNDSIGLKSLKKDNTNLYFIPVVNEEVTSKKVLVTVFLDVSLNEASAVIAVDHVRKLFLSKLALFDENPMKSATKKIIKSLLASVQDSITVALFSLINIPLCVEDVAVIQIPRLIQFDSWFDQQWIALDASIDNNIQSSNAISAFSARTTPTINASNSEKSLPPLVTPGKQKPARSNSFTQLFRRLLPRFENRSETPTSSAMMSPATPHSSVLDSPSADGIKIFSMLRAATTEEPAISSVWPIKRLLSSLPTVNTCDWSINQSSLDINILSVANGSVTCTPVSVEEALVEVTPLPTEWTIAAKGIVNIPSSDDDIYDKRLFVSVTCGDVMLLMRVSESECSSTQSVMQVIRSHTIALVNYLVWSKGILQHECHKPLL